jgi:protein SCO1/2
VSPALGRIAFLAAVMVATGLAGGSSDRSVYQLDSSWVEDNGEALRLPELRGDMQLLALIYTTCTGACPVTVKAMQMFSRNMPADIQGRTRFLLVTVDPGQDTLPVLRRYRREMKLDLRWKLLRGSASDVRELAAVLGFNYEQIESRQFAHANLVTVLNSEGEIVHQQNDFGSNTESVIDALRRHQIRRSAVPPSADSARSSRSTG